MLKALAPLRIEQQGERHLDDLRLYVEKEVIEGTSLATCGEAEKAEKTEKAETAEHAEQKRKRRKTWKMRKTMKK